MSRRVFVKKDVAEDYSEKISRVCEYIEEHLDEDLTVEILSEVADFSKYHFHRQFSGYIGISVFKFIQQLRLKRASYQLVYDADIKIIDIAMDANFEYPESFSRAFRKMFGQTPSEFRKKPEWKTWHDNYQLPKRKDKKIMQVNVIEFKETNIAVFEHRAAPELLNDSIRTFIKWRKESNLSPVNSSDTYGLAYDDPKKTKPEEFRFDICGSIDTEVPVNPQNVIKKVIPGGRCAVIRHTGSHDQMNDKIHYLYSDWLPESPETLRDFPCFFHYINLFPEVPEHDLITDIYLPLK
ncbi:MAG: AraC family transcriptional regulator [Deltaproteobacteria bacterium]|nr:AraC family transcriptional regulator [Deltaproteobacteria bacterium]